MPAKRDHQMLIDAARMYYIEGLDQGQVGRRLGLSRSSVSRILANARESGIVQVRIAGDDHVSRNRDLEQALVRTFGLREALVAETTVTGTELKGVGQLAAQIFTRRAPAATRIGFSWGMTIGQVIESIPQMTLRPDTRLTPLVGGMPNVDTGPSGNTNIQILAEKCSLIAERFDAPAIVESSITCNAMRQESSVKAALARARNCDLAFVGLGSFGVQTSKRVLEAMKLSEAEMAQVLAANPVGDLLGRFIDVNGEELGPPSQDRVIGISVTDLGKIEVVVGLAAGKAKAQGVLSALRTGTLDLLVVDEGLAAALLSLAATSPAAVGQSV